MKFLVAIFLAVITLEASVFARPDPFLGNIISALSNKIQGVKNTNAVAIAEIAEEPAAAVQQMQEDIVSVFANFGLPSLFKMQQRAKINPFISFLNAFVVNLKHTDSVVDHPPATAALNTISQILQNMDPTRDPIVSFIAETGDIGTAVVQGLGEAIPDYISSIGNLIFKQTQSRATATTTTTTAGGLLGDFSTVLKSFTTVITSSLSKVKAAPKEVLGGFKNSIDKIASNITQIKEKDDLKAGAAKIDLFNQVLGSMVNVIDVVEEDTVTVINTVLGSLEKQMTGALLNVTSSVEKQVNKLFEKIGGGALDGCVTSIYDSLEMATNLLNAEFNACLQAEVQELMKPFDATRSAFKETQKKSHDLTLWLDDCLSFKLFACGKDAFSVFSTMGDLVVPYAKIPLTAVVFSDIQGRLGRCVALNSVDSLTKAIKEALKTLKCTSD